MLFFAAANKSITIGIDKVPGAYSEYMDWVKVSYLGGTNHVALVDEIMYE